MTQHLHDALHAEYERARDALRPDGVAAVRTGATRRRRRQAFTGVAVLAVALTGGVTAWRLAPGREPGQEPGEDPGRVVLANCDRPGTDVAVLLGRDITDTQTERLDRALRDSPEVFCLTFESVQAAWQRFQQQFSDAPELVTALKPEAMTASFRFRVTRAADSDAVEQRVRGLAGVAAYRCSCAVKPS